MRFPFFVSTILLLGVGFLGISYANTVQHEAVHREIQEHYGCVDVVVETGLFGGSSKCLLYGERGPDQRREEYLLHTLNEIIGYNSSTLAFAMFVVVMVQTALLGVLINRGGE